MGPPAAGGGPNRGMAFKTKKKTGQKGVFVVNTCCVYCHKIQKIQIMTIIIVTHIEFCLKIDGIVSGLMQPPTAGGPPPPEWLYAGGAQPAMRVPSLASGSRLSIDRSCAEGTEVGVQ